MDLTKLLFQENDYYECQFVKVINFFNLIILEFNNSTDPPPKEAKEGHEGRKTNGFSLLYCLLYQCHNRKSMFAVLHSDINSLKSGIIIFSNKLRFSLETSLFLLLLYLTST
jgi:hypothetical protein